LEAKIVPGHPTSRWTAGRILVAAVVVGFGVLLGYSGAADWYAGVQSENWPTAPGTVLVSEVLRIPGHGRVAHGYRGHVEYRYRIGTRAYVGDRVSFGREWVLGDGSEDAHRVVTRFQGAQDVQVYYDPSDPDRAVLDPGWTWSAMLRVAAGLIIVLVGVQLRRFRSVPLPRWLGGTPTDRNPEAAA